MDLINSESVDNIFYNPDSVTNVKSTIDDEIIQIYSFVGYLDNTWKDPIGVFDIGFNPESLANILLLSLVTEKYWVTLDS